jgi:hypothetical protein
LPELAIAKRHQYRRFKKVPFVFTLVSWLPRDRSAMTDLFVVILRFSRSFAADFLVPD